MRFIVLLKSGRYYVCTDFVQDDSVDEVYRLANGGTVYIPKANIEAVEKYTTDNQIEYGLRPRLRSLESNEKYEEMR